MPTRQKASTDRRAQDIGMIGRLKAQLKVQKNLQQIHEDRRRLTELAFYPAHDKRKETKEYKAVHHHMAVELDLPCLICGVRNSTLKDKEQNRYGAKAMETHHHVIEWSLANAVDAAKFNKILLPNLAHKHPDKPEYQKPFADEDVRNWVDHSSDNLWVLCDVHHRAVYFGIHEITYPIWCPMDLLRDDFEDYVKQEIAKEKAAKKPASKKAAARAA
jgi:hypothetical protein